LAAENDNSDDTPRALTELEGIALQSRLLEDPNSLSDADREALLRANRVALKRFEALAERRSRPDPDPGGVDG
jgi:hypothetical protein